MISDSSRAPIPCVRCFGYLGSDGWDSCDGSRCHQGTLPSQLGYNALWQPSSPPVSTFATFGPPTNALWAFSQRPWVVDTSLTAHSTVSTFNFSFILKQDFKSKNCIHLRSFLTAYLGNCRKTLGNGGNTTVYPQGFQSKLNIRLNMILFIVILL